MRRATRACGRLVFLAAQVVRDSGRVVRCFRSPNSKAPTEEYHSHLFDIPGHYCVHDATRPRTLSRPVVWLQLPILCSIFPIR